MGMGSTDLLLAAPQVDSNRIVDSGRRMDCIHIVRMGCSRMHWSGHLHMRQRLRELHSKALELHSEVGHAAVVVAVAAAMGAEVEPLVDHTIEGPALEFHSDRHRTAMVSLADLVHRQHRNVFAESYRAIG